jgi:hypothetical protein
VPPKASKASAPPAAIGSVSSVVFAGLAVAAGAGAGFEFRFTTGATFDCEVAGAAVGGFGATAALAAGTAARVATVRVAVRVATGAGRAVETRVVRAVRWTERFAVGVAGVDVPDTGVVVTLSVVGAGSLSVGAGWAVVVGAGSVATGGVGCAASCARTGVEESASAAAIAGRALVRA